MNLTIERFSKGNKYYTDKISVHNGQNFQCIFGQCKDDEDVLIDYTLERKDTLIPDGVYKYDWYYSPANKMTVIRLTEDPNGVDIKSRVIEHHIANYPYDLKGCCAHGLGIDINVPMLVSSGVAIKSLFEKLGNKTGTITYKTI